MLIISIDPGINQTGVVLLLDKKVLFFKTIKTRTKENARFYEIAKLVSEIIEKYKPEYLAIESQYFAKNVATAMLLVKLRGIIHGVFFSYWRRVNPELDIVHRLIDVTPLEAKSAIGVSTKGVQREESKEAVSSTVKMLYPQLKEESQDVHDAVTIGLAAYNKLKASAQYV